MAQDRLAQEAGHFIPGTRCMLVVDNTRLHVAVLEASEDQARLSFPHKAALEEGQRVTLEFTGDEGVVGYESEILRLPKAVGDGLAVSRTRILTNEVQRAWWRVDTKIRAEVKGHVHPKRVNCTIENIAVGGALVSTVSKFQVGDVADLRFTIPGARQEDFLCEVVHMQPPRTKGARENFVGLRFLNVDQVTKGLLKNYVWRRLRELHPTDFHTGITT